MINYIKKLNYTYTLILIPFFLLKLVMLNNVFNVVLFLILTMLIENLINLKKLKYILIPLFLSFFYIEIFHDIIILLIEEIYEIYFQDQPLTSLWRIHYSLIFVLIGSILFSFLSEKKIKTFFLFFSISNLIFSINPSVSQKKGIVDLIQPTPNKKNKNTLILIILDEYASPSELINYLSYEDINFLSNNLSEDNWIIKRDFHSNETSTSLSMYSLFNYNLTGMSDLNQKSKNDLYTNYLDKNEYVNSKLLKDIRIKNLKMESYGLFDFNSIRVDDFLPRWETDNLMTFNNLNSFSPLLRFLNKNEFFYDIFSKTILSKIENRYNLDIYKETIFDYFNMEIINKYDFIYYHFLMPHAPFKFKNEFKYDGTSTEQYVEYWNFTSRKFSKILKGLNKEGNKIILIGDHGYRANKKINPNNTFGAFYGFNSVEVNKVETVQDVGLLIRDNLIE